MGVVYRPEDIQLGRNVVLNWFEELKRLVPPGKKPMTLSQLAMMGAFLIYDLRISIDSWFVDWGS